MKSKEENNNNEVVLVRIPRDYYERIARAGHKPGEYIRVKIGEEVQKLEAQKEEDKQ
jgi:hypothetical protein